MVEIAKQNDCTDNEKNDKYIMTDEQIVEHRKNLNQLTDKCSDKELEPKIKEDLKKLARKVGASTYVMWVQPSSSSIRSTPAETPELIRNIHQALQTASMVYMCKTATEGYEMATKVSRNACINFWIAAAIAVLSAVAAWVAVLSR